MSKNKHKMTLKKYLGNCCWCRKKIKNNSEVFSVGAKTQSGFDLSDHEGQLLPVTILSCEKTVYSLIPRSDSDAKKAGNDMLFLLCSENCALELKAAIQFDLEIGKKIILN